MRLAEEQDLCKGHWILNRWVTWSILWFKKNSLGWVKRMDWRGERGAGQGVRRKLP